MQIVLRIAKWLTTGFAGQESIAAATLIFGGVLHRHPKLDVCSTPLADNARRLLRA